MDYHVIDRGDLKKDPADFGALDADGRLQVFPHEFWTEFTQAEIAHFCVKHGFYCVPTTELVEWLFERIGDRKAIEIGSGSGVLADALEIQGTDNKMQEWAHIKALYEQTGQTPAPYGPNVRQMDAQVAVDVLKPKVVIAAWVTHKWNEKESWREGNMYGVREDKIVKRHEYIHIGNRHVHRHKPIMDLPHEEFEFPWLVSRAMNGTPNFIGVWQRGAGK
jgi:hypothetical protein